MTIFGVVIRIRDTHDALDFKAILDKHQVDYTVSSSLRLWKFRIKGQKKGSE